MNNALTLLFQLNRFGFCVEDSFLIEIVFKTKEVKFFTGDIGITRKNLMHLLNYGPVTVEKAVGFLSHHGFNIE